MEKKKNSIDKFWQVSSLEIPILPEKKAEANNVNLEVILALRKKVTIEPWDGSGWENFPGLAARAGL